MTVGRMTVGVGERLIMLAVKHASGVKEGEIGGCRRTRLSFTVRVVVGETVPCPEGRVRLHMRGLLRMGMVRLLVLVHREV